MTSTSAATTTLWQGAALGAGLGAAAMWLLGGSGASSALASDSGAAEEAGDSLAATRAAGMIEDYAHLRRDGQIAGLCAELAPLFSRLNKDAFRRLLQSLDDTARLMTAAREGTGRPTLVAQALRTRRTGGSALADLFRDGRRRAPSQTAELQELFDALQRYLEDSVHNIQQENSLRLWDSRAEAAVAAKAPAV